MPFQPHLLHDLGDTPTLHGVDDLHQGLFDARVLKPIRLHVDAKRDLCATWPADHAALSDDSKRSLLLHGGVFDAGQAAQCIARPGAGDAVRVCVRDDLAKIEGLPTPPLSHDLERATASVLRPQ